MNSEKAQKERRIFEGRIHTGVMQNKYPPGRITARLREPATATLVADLTPRVSTNPHRLQNTHTHTSPADTRQKPRIGDAPNRADCRACEARCQIRRKGQIKANLRYFTHRRGREHEKLTRAIFTNVGQTDKQEFYRQVSEAGRGTVFFKFMISPDPQREDSGKDLDLPYITRRTIRKLEQAIGRRLYFVAAVHNADHTPIRHVHGIFLTKGRLSREHFRLLQEVARAESTREALLQRQARDLIHTSPRYQVLIRREIIRGRGGGRVAKVQPGCRNWDLESSQAFPATARIVHSATQASGKSANPGFGFSRQK